MLLPDHVGWAFRSRAPVGDSVEVAGFRLAVGRLEARARDSTPGQPAIPGAWGVSAGEVGAAAPPHGMRNSVALAAGLRCAETGLAHGEQEASRGRIAAAGKRLLRPPEPAGAPTSSSQHPI
jgi:hypothetical protein